MGQIRNGKWRHRPSLENLNILETLKWSVSQLSTDEHLGLYIFDRTTQNLNTQGTFVCLSTSLLLSVFVIVGRAVNSKMLFANTVSYDLGAKLFINGPNYIHSNLICRDPIRTRLPHNQMYMT